MLPRYHIENYFLDEFVLAKIFGEMEPEGSWLRDPQQINQALRKIASETVPYAVTLKVSATLRERVGNVDVMPKGIRRDTPLSDLLSHFRERVTSEAGRVASSLNLAGIEDLARTEYTSLMDSISANTEMWKADLPGRIILKRFAGENRIPVGRLKTMYLRHAQAMDPDPFAEIRELFRSFRNINKRDQMMGTEMISRMEQPAR
jgi:hypothetical protein